MVTCTPAIMDPKVSKKTQETLGKIIKRPPLTDKLLAKPPFRFLHDIITSVINMTGFMQGLFSTEEQNSDHVKDKESKIAFLQKALDIVALVTGKQLPVKPSKIVAGHEPEKTNEFLQLLAEAINKQVDNDSYVQRVLSSRETNKSHPDPNKEKDRSRDKSSSRRSEKERPREKNERKEISKSQQDRHKEKDENENKTEERDKHKGKAEEKERRRSKTEDKSKERERPHRSRTEEKGEKEREPEKDREKEREKGRSEEKSKEKRPSDADRPSRKARKDDTKENEKPPIEKKEPDEKIEEPAPRRLPRPTSAKGSRQKREESGASPAPPPPALDESPKQPVKEAPNQLPKQVQMARPSSARPAPPKQRKSEVIATDPIIQLGSGRPTNVITDDAQESDEDEQFIVEDNTPLQVAKSSLTKEPDADDETEHGGLVKKILETKKELEATQETDKIAKTQIETSSMNNVAYQKQRLFVTQKIEKLQESIQTLTKSANPLGKIMDYIQEDLDSMQKELQRWKQERIQHTMALKHEKEITERTVEPLKLQLTSFEQAIKDQIDVIATVKANIIRNDKRIVSVLHSVAKV